MEKVPQGVGATNTGSADEEIPEWGVQVKEPSEQVP